VGSVKTAPKKTLGARCLTRVVLDTTLCDVESYVSSSLLTFVGDCVDSKIPLSPSHFLIGRVA
jgi:hypothetical protein